MSSPNQGRGDKTEERREEGKGETQRGREGERGGRGGREGGREGEGGRTGEILGSSSMVPPPSAETSTSIAAHAAAGSSTAAAPNSTAPASTSSPQSSTAAPPEPTDPRGRMYSLADGTVYLRNAQGFISLPGFSQPIGRITGPWVKPNHTSPEQGSMSAECKTHRGRCRLPKTMKQLLMDDTNLVVWLLRGMTLSSKEAHKAAWIPL